MKGFKSRKFLVALLGAVAMFIADMAGVELTWEKAMAILSPLNVYIGVEGFVDLMKKR